MCNRISEEMGKYSKPERLFEPEECPKSRLSFPASPLKSKHRNIFNTCFPIAYFF